MEFVVNLPKINAGFRLPGVYRLLFDDGCFYIGCSIDLRARADKWRLIIKKPEEAASDATNTAMMAKIKTALLVHMDIVEVCAPDEVKDREAFYLNEYKDNPLMLSVAECQFKPVLQYKKDGSFVKRHISITAAAKYNSTTLWRIQEVVNGNRPAHRNMVFVFEKDYNRRRKGITQKRYMLGLPKKTKNVKVCQYDAEGNTVVGVYDTYAEAGRVSSCDPGNIKRAIAGRQQTAGGFKWSLVSDIPSPA